MWNLNMNTTTGVSLMMYVSAPQKTFWSLHNDTPIQELAYSLHFLWSVDEIRPKHLPVNI